GDGSILRPETRRSPVSVSTGETPPRKMSKAVAPRDTKPDSGKQLTEGNLSSSQGSSEKGVRRLYGIKSDRRMIRLDRESGQAFLDHETFTKGHRLDFHSARKVDRSILPAKTGDSPRSDSTGESPQKKRG